MLKRFLVTASILLVSWLCVYHLYIRKHTRFDRNLSRLVVEQASSLLHFFDPSFHATISTLSETDLHRVCYNGRCVVGVGRPCNGLELFALFAGFILSFPGSWKNRLWFIPLGIVLIHCMNIVRVASLSIIQLNWPQYLDFNHKYTFTILVYACTFAMWMLWVKKFSGIEKTASKGT